MLTRSPPTPQRYAPLTSDTDGGVTSLDMTPRSAVVRSTKFLQADAEEEVRVKARTLTPNHTLTLTLTHRTSILRKLSMS